MAIALVVATVVIYVPGLNNVVLGGGPVPVLAYLAPIAAGTLLIAYEFLRIFLRRRGKSRVGSIVLVMLIIIILLGFFGGVPKTNPNLLELVRTTSSIKAT